MILNNVEETEQVLKIKPDKALLGEALKMFVL